MSSGKKSSSTFSKLCSLLCDNTLPWVLNSVRSPTPYSAYLHFVDPADSGS